jgi:phosphoglycolate phosphatase
MQKEIILWDWNGTMLNDVDICVDSINQLLSSRQMRPINSKLYKEVFDFPVRNYYETLGFDFSFESFEDLSEEFISTYNSKIKNAALHAEVVEVLNYFQAKGKTQIVISAMEQKMLEKMLNEYKISHFFKDVMGLSDIYATSKVDLARKYIKREKLNVNDAVFIGDTLHDAEVAEENGIDIILVSNGHHSLERLSVNGYTIIDNLGELLSCDNAHFN